jgi:predicted RNA-binding Zn-ribbon protein involved in translation (DUF1610 family)
MTHRIFKCESCPTEIGVDKKLKERPLACPKCRGMVSFDREGDPEGKTYDCPNCENSFVCTQEPFKCPFCDYTFSKSYKYF